MKKSILILGTAMFLFMGSVALTSCQSNEEKTEVKKEAAVYQCPMKCEGDKTYDKQGDCPKCGMELKKVDDTKKDNHQH